MQVIAIGSSIMQRWSSLASVFRAGTFTNLAIGGTQTGFWRPQIDTLLDDHAPDLVLYYCGSNDFNAAVPDEDIIANSRAIITAVLTRQLPIVYIPIIKAPQKAGLYARIDQVNAAVLALETPGLMSLDFNDILCPENAFVDGMYVEDQLHLTDQAYTAMSGIMAGFLRHQLPEQGF